MPGRNQITEQSFLFYTVIFHHHVVLEAACSWLSFNRAFLDIRPRDLDLTLTFDLLTVQILDMSMSVVQHY